MSGPVMTPTESLLHELGKPHPGVGESFWPGDGDTLWGRLADEGWRNCRYVAPYYWVMTYQDRYIAYTEGDIDFEDNDMCWT